MVDALVSGASALRHVGSSPILGTINKSSLLVALIFVPRGAIIYTIPPNLPLSALRFFSLLRLGIANEFSMLSP